MPIWAVASRPDPADSPEPPPGESAPVALLDLAAWAQLAYPAGEVDAWAEAVHAEAARRRSGLVSAAARLGCAQGQLRRAEAAREAIEEAWRAAIEAGPDDPARAQVLAEARGGALAVLASACRRVAELCGGATSPPSPEPVGVVAARAGLVTHLSGLDPQPVYLADEAQRYMDAVRAPGDQLPVPLDVILRRAEEAEDRLIALGVAISFASAASEVPHPHGPAPEVAGDRDDQLAATRRDALGMLALGRQAIAAMYAQAESDLFGAGRSWAGEQHPA